MWGIQEKSTSNIEDSQWWITQSWSCVKDVNRVPLWHFFILWLIIILVSFKGTKTLGWISSLGPCTVCVWCIFEVEGWSVEVKYWRTLRTRGRRAEGGLCLSLPGRWNKLKSIGNTFCPLASSLIMDTKHISVWEMPDTVMFYVIVYLIHLSATVQN